MENELSEPVALTLNHATPDVWHKIIEFYKKAAENGQTTLERIAKSNIIVNNTIILFTYPFKALILVKKS